MGGAIDEEGGDPGGGSFEIGPGAVADVGGLRWGGLKGAEGLVENGGIGFGGAGGGRGEGGEDLGIELGRRLMSMGK